jgi:phosphatidate cytidylyltransferase
MPDDPSNDTESGGFDDWLSEAPGKATDPYAELSDDAPDDDLAHEEPSTEDPTSDDSVDDDDVDVSDAGEGPVVASAEDLPADTGDALPDDSADDDDTGELPIAPSADGEAEAEEWPDDPVVEFEAFDGGDDADTGELEIVTPVPFGEGDVGEAEATLMYDGGFESESQESPEPSDSSDSPVQGEDDDDDSAQDETSEVPVVAWSPETIDVDPERDVFDPFEDTGEAVFVSGEMAAAGVTASAFGDLWDQDEDSPVAIGSDGDDDEFTLGEGDILMGATQEHIGLAAAIAAAENEDTEQVALVAEIPGLETSVVGFDDVVEAEGYRRVRARASGDLVARIVTGVVLVLALGASLIWRPALVAFAITVFVLGAGEFYTALVRTERKPIALFGFIGIISASLGAYFWSAVAIPMAFVLATILLLLFYAVVPGKQDPMGNLALTATVMVWAGLGSYAMLIARSDDYQVLIIGVVVAVAAADIAAFFVGRSLGRTHFAPWVSPKKTVEGLVAGGVVALGVGAVLHFFPPFELTSGLAVGAAAAFLTPIGDLAMSAAKRALGLKDMGSVLPGHGGFLDRIDGLLFVIPVAWAVFVWAGLL